MIVRKLNISPTRSGAHAFASPNAAISGAKQLDRELRTVADATVQGRAIQSVAWSDGELRLTLSGADELVFVACNGHVACLVQAIAGAMGVPSANDRILLAGTAWELDWPRATIAKSVVGAVIDRLWFSDVGVFLYLKGQEQLIRVTCLPLAEGGHLLYWNPSD